MFGKECGLTDDQIELEVVNVLKELSLKEKVWLLNGNWDVIENITKYNNPYNPVPIKTNGNERLGISPIAFTDGPRGVVMGNSTCFPVSMARGASFNRDLEKRIGHAIGKEARALGANYFAGVCINLLRHPAWGRAQETYGEDPFHIGEMGKALTESIQDHNVMACVKHFALNSIENSRFKVDVEVDDRTLREVYLPHFKKVIDGGAASVMGAYNKVNGDYCCENKTLLTDILRDEWGFKGFTSSDFFYGIRDTKKGIEAGMDVEMPMPIYYQGKLLKAVEDGIVSEEVIDESVKRVLRTLMVFENSDEKMTYDKDLVACKEHAELARQGAEESMVLLKNDHDVLPLSKNLNKVLVIGKLAVKANTGDHGSSRIYAPYVVTALEGIKNYVGEDVKVYHHDESDIDKIHDLIDQVDVVIMVVGSDCRDEGEYVVPEEGASTSIFVEGYKNQGMPEKASIMEAEAKKSKQSYTSTEKAAVGGDRKSLHLKEDELRAINFVADRHDKVVVCLVGGSMIMTNKWDDKVTAILHTWYSGMEGGNAIANVLFGEVNPSGKLPFIIPKDESHLPYFDSKTEAITYDYYHGYTKLDKDGEKAAYPFGFGLSYTTFNYSNLGIDLYVDEVKLTVTIENTGKKGGDEVLQAYVSMVDSKVERAMKQLKGFEKVYLEPGQVKKVTISIPITELDYYCIQEKKWKFESGTYLFMVGNSADDQRMLMTSAEINGR